MAQTNTKAIFQTDGSEEEEGGAEVLLLDIHTKMHLPAACLTKSTFCINTNYVLRHRSNDWHGEEHGLPQIQLLLVFVIVADA